MSFEATPSKSDTPGFFCCKCPAVVWDGQGFHRLQLPRNHSRVVQTSIFAYRSWQANVDFQVLLPDGDPTKVHFQEVAKLVDYVVSYICKGSESQVEEKKKITTMVLHAAIATSDQKDVKRLA